MTYVDTYFRNSGNCVITFEYYPNKSSNLGRGSLKWGSRSGRYSLASGIAVDVTVWRKRGERNTFRYALYVPILRSYGLCISCPFQLSIVPAAGVTRVIDLNSYFKGRG
jgi:hypothetical protein